MKKWISLLGSLLFILILNTSLVSAEEVGSVININGQDITLDSSVKAGKEEANNTQPPAESLFEHQESQRSFKSVSNETYPVYRLYNPRNLEHLYTSDSNERDVLVKIGWGSYEGVTYYAPKNDGIPVYRLYHKGIKMHLYTSDTNEKNVLSKSGWKYEGIVFQASTSSTGDIPVFRLYNTGIKQHLYTTDTNEKNVLSKSGWKYEGISWYAIGKSSASYDNYQLLNVNNYNQYALGAPSGCEGASLLQALQYKGKLTNWGLVQFLKTIPKSTNGSPATGFVGSPFEEHSNVYSAIYPAPLTSWAKKYSSAVQNISGSSVDTLLNEVKNRNPVVVWVTINFQPVRWGAWSFGAAVNNNHAVTLDGFNKYSNQVHVSDPISGSYWLSRSTFETIYNARKYAVSVR